MKQIKKNILKKQNKKVLVGISGGVDSSVSALLLKQQGYEVEGVFAKVWQPDFIECTWREEMKDAMRICAKLQIPFHFLDLEDHYKKHVADYMIHEYQVGRTPNPDVMCNTYIKFGFIYEYAIQHGFDYVATGHYAQNVNNQLKRGYDTNKDQSYFLWNVPKKKFEHILFPIGHLKKEAVRTIAQKNKLFTAEKKDSQGLCFIGPIDMKSFLKQLIITKKGDVRTIDGKVIGTHEGVELYTIGERHGFTIVSSYKTPNNKPLFVIDKDISNNILIVDIEPPHVKEIILDSVQIHDHEFLSQNQPTVIQVQFRYRQSPISAIYTHTNTQHKLTLEKPITNFIALGQSAVFYNKETCVGGGIIQKMVY